MRVTLYSTGCPKCNVLEKKLDMAGVEYTVDSNEEDFAKLQIMSAPALDVDGTIMTFTEAIQWVNGQVK